jgi:hypothetical protein
MSKALGWTPSFIGDLISGRRRLTLQRALELSRWLSFSRRETEKMVLLTLKENTAVIVKDFVKDQIKRKFGSNGQNLAPWPSDSVLLAVYSLIALAKGEVTEAQVAQALSFVPNLSAEQIRDAIVRLCEKEVMARASEGRFRVIQTDIFDFI